MINANFKTTFKCTARIHRRSTFFPTVILSQVTVTKVYWLQPHQQYIWNILMIHSSRDSFLEASGYRYSFICVVVRKLALLLTLTTESLMKWTVSSYRNEVFPHMLWISSNTWVRNTNEATWLVWSVFESSFDLWMKPLIDVRCNGRYDLCGALSCGVQQPALMFEHLMALSCFSFLKSYCVTWVLLNWQVCCVGVCGGDRFAQYGSLLRVRFFHVRNK